jgi:hypothetical protein
MEPADGVTSIPLSRFREVCLSVLRTIAQNDFFCSQNAATF